jgi:hypothetical protein
MRARFPKLKFAQVCIRTAGLVPWLLIGARAQAWDFWHRHPAPSASAGEVQQTVFGPVTFFATVKCTTVGRGHETVCINESKFQEKIFKISDPRMPFTLNIQNNGLSGAQIQVDHKEIWRADRFSSANELLAVPVRLRSLDELGVFVDSTKPGSSLTLWISASVGAVPPSPQQPLPEQLLSGCGRDFELGRNPSAAHAPT